MGSPSSVLCAPAGTDRRRALEAAAGCGPRAPPPRAPCGVCSSPGCPCPTGATPLSAFLCGTPRAWCPTSLRTPSNQYLPCSVPRPSFPLRSWGDALGEPITLQQPPAPDSGLTSPLCSSCSPRAAGVMTLNRRRYILILLQEV